MSVDTAATLVLAVDPPLPANSGARVRVLHLARALALGSDAEVCVGAPHGAAEGEPFGMTATGPHRRRASALAASVVQPYQSAKLNVAGVAALVSARRWTSVQCPLFLMPSALSGPAPVVLDAYDIESVTSATMAAAASSPLARARWGWEAAKTEHFERRLVPRAAAVCATSDADAAVLERLGARLLTVVPNGVDLQAVEHRLPPPDPLVVFVGSYDYRPNVDAANELVRFVLPRIRERVPDARLLLVGRRSASVAGLASDFVEVAGEVADVVSELHRARATVVPLRSGSGTRLKVLEALAAGVPVVSTAFGVAGIGASAGREVMLADTGEDLADAAVRVLTDDALALALSVQGRSFVEARYDWRVVAAPLVEIHRRLRAR